MPNESSKLHAEARRGGTRTADKDKRADSAFSIFSASQIGESNKRRVLQMLFDLGPTSRAELARLTGTKRTTITGIVQPMIESGLLQEIEPQERRGVGKPARPLWFSGKSAQVCAVVLLSDRIETALISLTGEVTGRRFVTIPPDARSRADYEEVLRRGVRDALDHAEQPAMGVGIAVGGMVDPDEGRIEAMNLAPALAGMDLAGFMSEEFGLDAVVDHHPRAILLGERWFGVGRGLSSFAVIYADEVLGCAAYLDGKPFRGPQGSGGELGHTIVQIDGDQCTCGKRGCWETVATLSWLRREAAALGFALDPEAVPAGLADLAESNEKSAALLARYARNLAVGLANLQTLMMPDNFILYGKARSGGQQFLETLETELSRLTLPVENKRVRVLKGRDEAATTLRGAAGLVINKRLEIEY